MFGVDVHDEQLMTTRSWLWLRGRVIGLLTTDCRLYRDLAPKEKRTPHGA